jgi:hypothetical protein
MCADNGTPLEEKREGLAFEENSWLKRFTLFSREACKIKCKNNSMVLRVAHTKSFSIDIGRFQSSKTRSQVQVLAQKVNFLLELLFIQHEINLHSKEFHCSDNKQNNLQQIPES